MQESFGESWRAALLPRDATLKQAIQNLSDSSLQIVMVVDDNGHLAGTVTDGDVRRGLIRDVALTDPVSVVMNDNPFVVPPDMPIGQVKAIMRANRFHQIPVVEEGRKLCGLHLWDDLESSSALDNQFVIMAGGEGKRLRPFTESCPKPMLEVAGKPMLAHIVERAVAEGFTNITMCLNYLGHMIVDYFGDGAAWGATITYVHEEEKLGTAGALGLLDPVPNLPFIVTNGDVMTDIAYLDLLNFHNSHRADATMAVRQMEWRNPYGVVKTNGLTITGFEEKPVQRHHVNAGIYALEPSALCHLKAGDFCDMPTLFTDVSKAGGAAIVFPMHEPWMDVGRPDDLEKAHDFQR